MCGITGFWGSGNRETLVKMTDKLHHRGPNDEGFYFDGTIGLGHKRLSIIDLSSFGKQPMSNEDGSILIIFNGEIYNFQELKKGLEERHNFKSQTDTEVILRLYEEIGDQIFSKMNGMFAIAIFDKKRKKIILARDRMGKKPLFWGVFKNTFIFGSELKALLEHPQFERKIDLESLNKYLTYEYVPTPNSIFENVYKLEPGHCLKYDGKNIEKKCFWDIKFREEENSYNIKDVLEGLDNKINEAVKTRLISDVPLGVFLSGGIDSSAICYYAQKLSTQKIKTFSIGFKEQSFDESKYARLVAKYLKTDHHEKILNAKDSLDLIPKIADLLDEPLADASIVPTYLLSKFAREHVTVTLGGDGGDELFCGYDTFRAHKLADIYEHVPLFIRKNIIERLTTLLPTSFDNISFDFKAKKFLSGFYGEKKYRDQRWMGSFTSVQKKKLFLPHVLEKNNENEFNNIDNYLENVKKENFYNQLIYLYLKMYMMDDILVKVDRASMYNSLEVRAPLIDYRVVDFVNNIPIDMKIKGLKTKYILKKLMQDKLPKEIINRPKKGFGMPIAQWLCKELKPLALDLLSEEKLAKQGIFDYNYVNRLLADHFSHKKDNRKLIWTLMVFQMWQEKWLNN